MRRYQVFVSSTYKDLARERLGVASAIWLCNSFPIGMEIFPASSTNSLDLIKEMIIQCDYYILIISGRYGSIHESGRSYTEFEYDFALNNNIPILPFLRKDWERLPASKRDDVVKYAENLSVFRQRVEKNHSCQYWKTNNDLQAKITTSLRSEFERVPRKGLIVPNDDRPKESHSCLMHAFECAKHNCDISIYHESKDTIDRLTRNIDPHASGSFNISILFGDELVTEDILECSYIHKFETIITGRSIESDSDTHIAGYSLSYLVKAADALEDGYFGFDLFDAHGDILCDLFHNLYDKDGKFLPALDSDSKLIPNFLYMYTIDLLPIYRGKRLGLAIAKTLMNVLASDTPYIVLDINPRVYDPKQSENGSWHSKLGLFDYNLPKDDATKRLEAYFMKLGAVRLKNTSYMYIDTTYKIPTMSQIMRGI